MARKSSVIMSAAERKTAQSDLKSQIRETKDALKTVKQAVKDAEGVLKLRDRELALVKKNLLGLETRHNALKPAPKPAVA